MISSAIYLLSAVLFLLLNVPQYRKWLVASLEYTHLPRVTAIAMSYASFALNVVRNRFYKPKKTSKPTEILQQTFRVLVQFLRDSGSGAMLRTGIWNSRFPVNLLILHQVHKRLYKNITHLSSNEQTSGSVPVVSGSLLTESLRMLRFASAIYGHDILMVCEFATSVLCSPRSSFRSSLGGSLKKSVGGAKSAWKQIRRQSHALCFGTGCERSDILVRNWPYGGSIDYTNHTVVLDHKSRSIIIAIRGTSCVSDILVDIACYTTDFCGGQAHSGMARMARATWTKATQLHGPNFEGIADDYDIVITGHSLGAGVAALMTIMVLHEKLVDITNRSVRCFTYACPPIYYGHLPDNIKNNITAYINGSDCIARMSIHNLLHLNACLVAVDRERKLMSYWQTFQLVVGWSRLPSHLIDAVSAMTLGSIEGVPPLTVPAGNKFWMRRVGSDYRISERIQNEGHFILLTGLDMFSNHLKADYEVVLRKLHSPFMDESFVE